MKKEVKDKLVHLVVLYNEIDILKTRHQDKIDDMSATIHDMRISDAIDILIERVKEIKEELIKLPESDDSI